MKQTRALCILYFFISLSLQGCLKSNKALSEANQNNTLFTGAVSAEYLSGSVIRISWGSSWSSDSSIASFKVYSVDGSGLTYLAGVPKTDFEYLDGISVSGKIYKYIVHAMDTAGVEDTNTNTVMALAYQGITSATAVDASSANLVFPALAEASGGFNIYCGLSSGSLPSSPTHIIQDPTATSYVLTGLTTGTNYSCKVKAFSAGIEDTNSVTASFTTL